MEEDVERTIERINERIKELEDTKRVLMQTFGIKTSGVVRRRFAMTHPIIPSPPSPPSGRKGAIQELLRQRGPMSKTDILEQTGFPEGTVSYVLNDKEIFQNIDGKWSLCEGGAKDDVMTE
jgi:hypothetical protein